MVIEIRSASCTPKHSASLPISCHGQWQTHALFTWNRKRYPSPRRSLPWLSLFPSPSKRRSLASCPPLQFKTHIVVAASDEIRIEPLPTSHGRRFCTIFNSLYKHLAVLKFQIFPQIGDEVVPSSKGKFEISVHAIYRGAITLMSFCPPRRSHRKLSPRRKATRKKIV